MTCPASSRPARDHPRGRPAAARCPGDHSGPRRRPGVSRGKGAARKDPREEAFHGAARAVFEQRMFRTMADSAHDGRALFTWWTEDDELSRARGWAGSGRTAGSP
ncbi:hypothetical protein ACFQZ4_29565 [Catellatospora coxensis]